MRAAAAAGVLAALLASSAGAATTAPSFGFGRYGGNIRPLNVRIAASGRVTVNGNARAPRLTRTKLAALLRTATAQRFFALPKSRICPNQLPDFGWLYVTVRDGTRTRTVAQLGRCNLRFIRVYDALDAAVGGAP